MVRSLPTAVMTPREIRTVAFSMGGPETGTTLAPRMAKWRGSPPCACKFAGKHTTSSKAKHTNARVAQRFTAERMRNSFFDGSAEIKPPGVTGVDARHKQEVSQCRHKKLEFSAPSGLLFPKESAQAAHSVGRGLRSVLGNSGDQAARATSLRFEHASSESSGIGNELWIGRGAFNQERNGGAILT